MLFRFSWDYRKSLQLLLSLGKDFISVERTVAQSSMLLWTREQCSSTRVVPEIMLFWGRRGALANRLS